MCYPWLLAGLVDPRRVRADQQMIADTFMEAIDETLDSWFGKEIYDSVESSDDLLSGIWQCALWLWAWQIMATIAQAEFQHRRNRAKADRCDMWTNSVAKSYNCEAALPLQWQHRALVDIATMDGHVRN